MAVGEDVVGADGLTNLERFEMRRERKRQQAEERAARDEAARQAAIAAATARAEAAGGMLSTPPEPTAEEVSGYKRYNDLLNWGIIDEQGNILKPGSLNATEIIRGDIPSWASPELIKNAYIQAFESQSRAGQDFMDGGDYQNFLNAGYSLTEDQISSLGGVQNQGNQDGLSFGHEGQPNTGVANPPPPQNTSNPPMSDDTFETDRPTYTSAGDEFMDGYNTNQPEAPAPIDPTQPVATQNTPFADAYFKAMEAAKKKGPVSSMFADMMPGE